MPRLQLEQLDVSVSRFHRPAQLREQARELKSQTSVDGFRRELLPEIFQSSLANALVKRLPRRASASGARLHVAAQRNRPFDQRFDLARAGSVIHDRRTN